MTQSGDRAPIGTDRLIVRPWRLDEADRFFDIYRRIEVVRWLAGIPMKDRREAVERIERNIAQLASDPRFGSWAVVERSSGVPAGTLLLKPLPDGDGEIEIGWHFHPDRWGMGFASESAAALLERGFADGLEEVWAVTHLDNGRSMAVCTRIGMRLLGITHRWYHVPSRMFWAGARPGREPSLRPEEPAPPPPQPSVSGRAPT
jgi:RimJ/RimL family protein N-acetyltransferase